MPAAHKEDGAVLVEFAAVVPLFLLLVIGMLQFGIVLNAKIDEIHLASSGARYAAVNQNPGGGSQTLQDYIKSRANTADLRSTSKVCVDYPVGAGGTSGKPGDPVRVTMSYVHDLVPLLGDALGGVASLTIVGDATMRLEALPTEIAAGCSV